MFNEKRETFTIMINADIITESIFKDSDGRWVPGYQLMLGDTAKSFEFIAPYKTWTKAADGIEIISKKNNKSFKLTQTDVEAMKAALKERDKRLKI